MDRPNTVLSKEKEHDMDVVVVADPFFIAVVGIADWNRVVPVLEYKN
jgi:hypothetical protein